MDRNYALDSGRLVKYLKKPAEEFTRADLIKYIEGNGIKMLNFRYIAGDGRLKTLNFVINSREHLEEILTIGERVDGSSLFDHIDTVSSDLYVIPDYKTAFVNPFTEEPTLDVICRFFTNKGEPSEIASDNLLLKAHNIFREKTKMEFEALGELEYYLFSETDTIFPITEQKGYHESHPFSKWGNVRREAMMHIAEIGCNIKYGHAEVGNIIHDDIEMVQHEIEFLPMPVEKAADQLVIAKWVVRETAYKYGLEVSFAPKIMIGQAGSGLHVHTRIIKDNKNAMISDGKLNNIAFGLIGGFMKFAKSLTAFGNSVPTSYLRLVPHQEAPTSICWGERNRLALVRVPLGWNEAENMIYKVNPHEPKINQEFINKQTVEIRSADGSANIHHYFSGLTVAALYGILNNDEAVKIAKEHYIDIAAGKKGSDFEQLPTSCYESADALLKDIDLYLETGVFSRFELEAIAEDLKSQNDKNLRNTLLNNIDELRNLVDKYIYCG